MNNEISNYTNHTMMTPWVSSPEVQNICSSIFQDSPFKKDDSSFKYDMSNDFGKIIHKLLFCKPHEKFSSGFFKDICEIGQIEKFEVCKTNSVYSVRDPILKNGNAQILRLNSSPENTKVLNRLKIHGGIYKNRVSNISNHPFFQLSVGEAGKSCGKRTIENDTHPIKIKSSRLYFEGGDCFNINNKNNISQWIVGKDLILATHQVLLLDEWFEPIHSWNPSQYDEEKFSDENNILYQWFTKDEIPHKIDEIATRINESVTDKEIEQTILEILQSIPDDRKKYLLGGIRNEKKIDRESACKFLAQIEFIKKQIFPIELSISKDQINFVEEPAYHLDLVLAPAPKGALFVQDYSLAVKVLQAIKANTVQLNLEQIDIDQLNSYIETTQKLCEELYPFMKNFQTELGNAGFNCIPTPGAFFGFEVNDHKNQVNVNFLNCITGFSPENQHFYYIASGAQTEGKLGQILMDTFVEFLNHHANQTVTYFVGRNPGSANNYSEAMMDLNKYYLGPHCLSFELEIEPHVTTI